MYEVTLKRGKENRAKSHPWIYANEVEKVTGKDKQGSVAKVLAYDGSFLGYGFINHASKIFIRILSRKESQTFDNAFFESLLYKAIEKREKLGFTEACRLVFGESDDLPGLIVDKYGEYLSVQFLSLGMELLKETIVNALVQKLAPKGIYERSDSSVREKEGLQQTKGLLYGEVPPLITFTENGVLTSVSLAEGQKTGYFLDQRRNRLRFGDYAKGKRVLDCFSNVGGFALQAAKNGAKEVVALDASPAAVALIRQNASQNGLSVTALEKDVFEALREYRKEGEKFDLICLDPPAFIKTVDSVQRGYEGYRDINVLALKLLEKDGILFTCSCSQHLTVELFLKMLRESARYANSDVSLLEFSIQNADHACKITEEEALYLKVAVLRKNG